jgi:protein-S-isoprenylcysteine O-methyltransferase Ste14
MLPQYFLFDRIGRDNPPAITHPEYFYGFVGIVSVWQIAFLVIAREPERYRALMPVTVLEKLVFAVPVLILFAQGRVVPATLFFAGIDLVLGALFLVAWRKTVSG